MNGVIKLVSREEVVASGKPYRENGHWKKELKDLFVGLTYERCERLGSPVIYGESPVAYKQQEASALFMPLYDRTLDVPIHRLRKDEIITTDGS